MPHTRLSRRCFALMAGTAGILEAQEKTVTAGAVIDRIKSELGGDWPSTGPEGFKAGDPSTPVKGIATTAMATLDVLKQAVASGSNLVLTYEPTFYGRADGPSPPPKSGSSGRAPFGLAANDRVYASKREYIERNSLVIYRLRDHWQARKQSDMVLGLAEALEWSRYRVSTDARRDEFIYQIPTSNAEEAVASIRTKLQLRGGLRAVGDRKARVRRILLHPGTMPPAVMWARSSDADLMVTGEVREWENTHYAADLNTEGIRCGLVTIGGVVSEEPGMRSCAAWLKGVVPEVPCRWISAGDPYWRAV